MAEEKSKRERFCFGPLYAPKDMVEKINSIPEIASGVTGTDKVVAIINGLSFYHQWKDKVANLESGIDPDAQARIEELESQLATEQDTVRSLSTDYDRCVTESAEKDAHIAELEAKVQAMGELSNQSHSEHQERIAELEAQVAALQAQKPSWDAIKSTLDPVYAEMMESVALQLKQDDPLLMAVDIFAKYHILRYTELPFQPFIPEKVLNTIIESHYPELGGLRGLQKHLR